MLLNGVKRETSLIFVLVVAVTLACLLAYGLGLNGPLFFDDVPNLLANELVQIDGGKFDDWRVAAVSSDAGLFFRPVAMLSFALNHVVFGSFSAISLKAINLAIHLAIGGLVYFFAQALLAAPALNGHRFTDHQRRLVAVIAASIWLLHPIHVSTVLYAVQRMAQLSALFTLAGLLVFVRYRLRWAESGAPPGELLAAFIWLLLLGALALLSKENGALMPWLIAVVEVTLFRGIWCSRTNRQLLGLSWLVFLLPILAVMAVLLVAPEVLADRFGRREFTLEERFLTQGRILWQYLSWMLLPNIIDMGFFHDDIAISRSFWSPFTTGVALIAWVLVFTACLLWHQRYPLAAFAVLFYLAAHSMESSVLPLDLAYEHRNYLPSIGLAVLAAVGVLRFAAKFRGLRLPIVLAGTLGALVVLLALRTHAWGDEMTLARVNVVNHPQSARANFFYANTLFKRFQQAQALGLDDEEKRVLAVTSRGHFERMHNINEREFAALVMLYQLDTLYFPGLLERNDWLGAMEELATTRRLRTSDRTALSALVGFSMTPVGDSGRARVTELVDYLVEHSPWYVDLIEGKFKLLAGTEDEDARRRTLLVALERAVRLKPQSRQAAAFLAQYHGSDDLAATYGAIGEWMRRDPWRREVSVIREIFEN